MYIRRIRIHHIKSITELEWKISQDRAAGWHVILGDNGAGKTTFVRSIALGLVGDPMALRQNWNDWLQHEQSEGRITLDLVYDPDFDQSLIPVKRTRENKCTIKRIFERGSTPVALKTQLTPWDLDRYISKEKSGWFSASYGPFRRFTGGDQDYEKLVQSFPKLAAHVSVFGENIALTECLQWLQELQFQKLENRSGSSLLDSITQFINQPDFLPHHARLHEVSSRGVEFIDGNGYHLPVAELSDGYRAILSMTFELIRQLSRCYEIKQIFNINDPTKIIAPGVVLIDEVDAHLHPSWQRKIGLWFREHFPQIQFIVTTHSPLVCQAAEVGSVWRLPNPGSDEQGRMISDRDLDRLIYGNILDAYGTEIFGADITRSESSKQRLRQLAELNRKELRGQLTDDERTEQATLRATLPTAAHTTEQAQIFKNSE